MSGTNGSPSFLPPHPKRGLGVRRLNKVPIWIALGAASAALGAVAYTYHLRAQAQITQSVVDAKRGEAGRAAVLDGAPSDGVVLARLGVANVPSNSPAPSGDRTIPVDMPALPSDSVKQGDVEDDATKARRQAWQVYHGQLADLQRQRHETTNAAMRADTSALTVAGGDGAAMQAGPGAGHSSQAISVQGVGQGPEMGAPGGLYAGGYPGGYGYGAAPALPDATGAREKQAFLGQRGSDGTNDTLIATVREPISPYLITAGDYIQVVMQGGADSDTPGQLVGRVVADVYDSATGRYRLIPANSKIVGVYDNVVSAGQGRLPSVINRIIFPDSSSLSIGAMPAADQAGFAGLHDQVERHLWEKFGNALIVAVAGAGIQLSQPQGRGQGGYDSQQLIAGSLGQQFGALGQEVARSGLAIPNTVRIRPGYRFTIQVMKDMVLRPYVDGRTRGTQQVHFGPFVQ
jgi:type IV secretory pathway VirB10-like protein